VFDTAAISAVVVRTVDALCTIGTISAPVSVAAAVRFDIAVLAMLYPWSRKSPFSSNKKSVPFSNKIPVVTGGGGAAPPPTPRRFAMDRPKPNGGI
jgi:hypothetical protein